MAPVLAASAEEDPPPLVWRAWADAVVLYWESCHANGDLDLAEEALVLDLGGAAGMLAWAMPAMLAERLAASPCAALQVRYMHDWPDDACANPLVCLGWRAMAALPVVDYAVQRGHAYVAVDGEWRPCAPPPGRTRALLDYYAARCGSAALALPLAALAVFDAIAQCSGGRYLLLGADAAIASEAAVRTRSAAGDLNLHAVLLDRAWAGAVTWCHQPGDAGCAVFLVAGPAAYPQPFDAMAAVLEQGHPAQAWALRAAAAALAPEAALQRVPALLRCAGDDPVLLAASMPALVANASIADSLAAAWRAVLPATWRNYRLPPVSDGFYRDVCALAAAAGDWGLAQQVVRTACEHYGAAAHDLQLLAFCASASGGVHAACDLLERAVALASHESHDPAGAALLAAAQRRVDDANAMHGYVAALARDGDLALEPLHADHAPALLHQYRDPGIAAMADLAGLHSVAQARQWIRAQRLCGGLQAYAVMHARWGFVGAVFLRCSGGAGYFYFWTGSDFQGRGYGPLAAQLLWALARHGGIRHVYTSVYCGNGRSRGALARLGFAPLTIRAQAPDQDLRFVHKVLDHDAAGGAHCPEAELRTLCRAIDSPMTFDTPSLCTGGVPAPF